MPIRAAHAEHRGHLQAQVDEALFEKLENRVEGGAFRCGGGAWLRPGGDFRFQVERELLLGGH